MKLYKNLYKYFTLLFILITFVEFVIFLIKESNYYGMYYIFINLFIIFNLILININYKKGNKKIRLSKSIINLIVCCFNNFFLLNVLNNIYKYVDFSKNYIASISVFKIIKFIILLILVILCILDLYKIDICDYKVYKHNK